MLMEDDDDDVDVEFNLIKNTVQQERVCHVHSTTLTASDDDTLLHGLLLKGE